MSEVMLAGRIFKNGRGLKHGLGAHPLRRVLADMKQRCNNPNSQAYKHYGGRGIECRFCSVVEFVAWAEANGYRQGLSIDRINNDGHYEPSNCRWVDQTTQMRNMRRNRVIEIDGTSKTLVEWAEAFGINYQTVKTRMHRGCTALEALNVSGGAHG